MAITIFLTLLSGFSIISGLVTEGIKKLLTDQANLPYNIIALITALIVGSGGTAVFYLFNAIPFTFHNIICMILMGFASGLASMVGFDKVKQGIKQLSKPDADNKK